MNGLFAAWIAETVIITWRSFTREQRPPLPSEFVAAYVIFGTLGLIAESPTARPAAVAVGWGLVVATVLRLGPADFNRAADGIAGDTDAGRAGGIATVPTAPPLQRGGRPI